MTTLNDRLDALTHKLLHQKIGLVSVRAEDVLAGTFSAGSFIFPSNLTVAQAGTLTTPWIELRNTAGDASIDFTRTPGSADYDVRLTNDAAGVLSALLPSGVAIMQGSAWRCGTYNPDNSWAHFGHKNRMNASSTSYAFMHSGSNGDTIVSSEALTYLRSNGASNRLVLTGNGIEVYTGTWLRDQFLYMRSPGDTNHRMSYDGSVNGTLIASYDRSGFYRYAGGGYIAEIGISGAYSKFSEAAIGTWAGGHATVGRYGNASFAGGNPMGYMMRSDGYIWIGYAGTCTWRSDGADIMQLSNSGGWCDFRPNLYNNLAGSTVQRAGSNQLGYVASRTDVKTGIKRMKLGRNNPLFKVIPRRFHWDEYEVVGGKDHNDHAPDGIAGVLIEDLAPLAPDACHPSVLDGKPAHLDERVLIGYTIEALQTLASEIDELRKAQN